MKSTCPNTDDEIEVLADNSRSWGWIRIRTRRQGSSIVGDIADVRKCSIFLTPDQLEEHARACLALATKIRGGQ